MKNRVRYTVENVSNNRFYQMPKFLFEGEFKKGLSNDAKVLYSLLRDRHELSLQNQWFNKNNEIYLIYTRENMQDMLGCSYNTARKAIDQLKKLGLMEEERLGLNRANRIYLTAVSFDLSGVSKYESPEFQNMKVRSFNICKSRVSKYESQEFQNMKPNDTNFNNTEFSDTQSINQENPKQIDVMDNQNIDFLNLKKKYPHEKIINDLEQLMQEVASTRKKKLHIASEQMDIEEVRKTFSILKDGHIEYVIECFNLNTEKIKNIKAYLLTMLYNSPTTINSYYSNQVKSDFQ